MDKVSLRKILKHKQYKSIFNEIYKRYLKKNKSDQIYKISLDVCNFLQLLKKQKDILVEDEILVTELEQNKFDVNIYLKESDEIILMQEYNMESIMSCKVCFASYLSELEACSIIIWELFNNAGEQ